MENGQVQPSLAVAIDKDKGSQIAVKWTVDNLVSRGQTIILIHVKTKAASSNPNCSLEVYAKEFFLPFRCFCSRKDVHCKDVILEDNDVAKAVTDFVSQNVIVKLVVGAPVQNAFSRFKTSSDIPTTILKGAPDFCTVHIISRGKVSSLRNATRPAPSVSLLWHQLHNQMSAKPETINPMLLPAIAKVAAADSTLASRSFDQKETIKSPFSRRGSNAKSYGEITLPETDISFVSTGRPSMDRMFPSLCDDDHDINGHAPRLSDASGCRGFEIMCSPRRSTDAHMMGKQPSSTRTTMDDMETEMRRLRLELKQTMDMYSTACKEALLAKKKAGELRRWRKEEERRLHEAKLAEEAALAIAAKEKEKCKVALEAAEAAQKLAKLESEKRINAEKKAQKEAEERKRAMESLVNANVRYRKYTIEEIEVATEYFAQNRKIGEGGYGPVYMCNLDHTPVAIKVLRPDAAQGRSQFQQEVGVLSCIRHPNMVLLLGACPEYGCLVYEYMANGSLDDRLFRRGNTPVLPWQLRFRIAAEIATALLFLHQTKPEPLVHRDLKPANILLDSNYVSKISDVGLARLVPPSVADSVTQYRLTSTAGTFCYIDPEYQQTGMLGRKSDIYSLGILLLQMITVKPPMGVTHHVARAIERGAFEEVLDKEVKDWPVEEALVFAKLALKCAELRRKDRPDLEEHILPELERLRSIGDDNSVAPPLMMHHHLPNQAHDVLTETHVVPSEISRTSTSSSHEKKLDVNTDCES